MKKTEFILFLLSLILCIKCNSGGSSIDLDYQPDTLSIFSENFISTNLNERDIAISPAGDEIIYTLNDYKSTIRCLVAIKKTNGKWGKKEILNISGQYHDIEPCFSADGNKLFFASDRPVSTGSQRKDYNIWVSERTDTGWSPPSPLPPVINTEDDEFFPSVSRNNNLYFTAARQQGIGKEDIFLSRYIAGSYSDPLPLDTAVNSPAWEFNAWISPGEDMIIFTSFGRDDDIGGGDLYFSEKDENNNWKPAKNLGPAINSSRIDYCPFIDLPRGNLYFTSDRFIERKITGPQDVESFAKGILNGMGNIYRVRWVGMKLPDY